MITVKIQPKNNHLEEYYSLEEEAKIYDKQLKDIASNPRWYLDNIDCMRTYRVSWKNYNRKTPTLPLRFVKSGRDL